MSPWNWIGDIHFAPHADIFQVPNCAKNILSSIFPDSTALLFSLLISITDLSLTSQCPKNRYDSRITKRRNREMTSLNESSLSCKCVIKVSVSEINTCNSEMSSLHLTFHR